MDNYQDLIAQRNLSIANEYEASLADIQSLLDETNNKSDPYLIFFSQCASWILATSEFESVYSDTYYLDRSLAELQTSNKALAQDILPGNYKKSFANPSYAKEVLGATHSPLFSYFYTRLRKYSQYAIRHKRYEMNRENRIFLEFYSLIKKGRFNFSEIISCITRLDANVTFADIEIEILERFCPNAMVYTPIVTNSDIDDLRYLYQYGKYITQNEIQTAQFLNQYPVEEIQSFANTFVSAFIRGFTIAHKDISRKKTIPFHFNIGQEQIYRLIHKTMAEKGLQVLFVNANSTPENRQFSYDHRFDNSLYFSSEYMENYCSLTKQAFAKHESVVRDIAGPVLIDRFGEPAFYPEHKKECLKLNDQQHVLMKQFAVEKKKILNTYLPRSKTSFAIVAFPMPVIGKDFPVIFEETMRINSFDSLEYERIHQKIIDVLDLATYVKVQGKYPNHTDITVQLHPLPNPDRETLFENCGATVNIPVGEVFTTPKLDRTSGVLNVSEVYMRELKYVDLYLEFRDGYIVDYTCKNFPHEEDNKKYIEENLLFPNKSLPLGEFAIGTNTAAYILAKKYKILHLLPILIAEKMGPHFALGDTCYSFEEDNQVFNPITNKEIIARENEKTMLRKQDVHLAYTGGHIDITLPFDELEAIIAVTANGDEYDIIRDGLFAIDGTDALNKPLIDYFT